MLSLKITKERIAAFGRGHFYFGLVGTWVAGIGHYWDNPKAEFGQQLGMGSVIYIFVMSAILWCVLRPLAGRAVGYFNIVTMVSLTSFPALLYAIPVERFMRSVAAIGMNVWFLAVVATWRAAILVRFVRVSYLLDWFRVAICCLLPLTAIVCALAVLNLEHVVFQIMGGLRGERSSGEGAYLVVALLAYLSTSLFPFVAIAWAWSVYQRNRHSKVSR
jgi:hypothetical protein